MKRNVTLFPRSNYATSTGNIQLFTHDPGLIDVLGQAKTIKFQVFVYKKSPTAQMDLKVYESADSSSMPRDNGNLVTPINRTGLGGIFPTVTGPLCGRIEVCLEISDTAGPNPQDMDLEVFATLIIEE